MQESHYFKTKDAVNLHYYEAGEGELILMLPGGGFSAALFKHQIEAFSSSFKVIALDQRGHGLSDKVDFGYRIPRLAEDLKEFIEEKKFKRIHLIGHSLGASVIFEYIDLFGLENLARLIIIDEPPTLLINPAWSSAEKKQYGAIYEPASLHELVNRFKSQEAEAFKDEVVSMMTSHQASEEQKTFIRSCMDLPGDAASLLYFNNICQDFRDTLKKITIPTLFITGRASLHPWESHQWMQQQVQGSELEVFEEKDGGNHFMFVENPHQFNQRVLRFLQKPSALNQ